MKIVAVNGSARRDWNTGKVLNSAVEGAVSAGAEVEVFNLYDLDYKGCRSCFECKRKGGESYGKCVCRDGLTELLEKAREADGLILASPIYFSEVSGEMKSFLERLMFPALQYDLKHMYNWPKKAKAAFIYVLGSRSFEFCKAAPTLSVDGNLAPYFTSYETLVVEDTYQFPDYSQYYAPMFSEKLKKKRLDTQFPKDLEKAFDLGKRMAE